MVRDRPIERPGAVGHRPVSAAYGASPAPPERVVPSAGTSQGSSMTSIVAASQYLFTSESVTEGHPDKMCDQVSDAILDAIIKDDPNARVACETATTTGLVVVLGEISTTTYVDFQSSRSRHRPRHRLHESRVRLRLHDLRHDRVRPRAVARHRPGRRRGARGPRGRRRDGAGRRRPGDDVRLRLPRDAGAHAAADRPRPPDGPPPRRGPQVRPAAVPPARRQDAGHDRVRARRREAGSDGRRLGPARPRRPRRAAPPGHRRDRDPADDPERAARRRSDHARQPDRPLRHRRPDGRLGPDRPQDHRRQLRRDGPPRRRRVLRQGPDEGRPVRRLRRPLGRQEHRRGRDRRPVRDRARLRHRHRPTDLACPSSRSGPASSPTRTSRRSSSGTSTSVPRRSSPRSTCAGRSTARPPRTGTSGGRTSTCPGSAPTRPPSSRPRPAFDSRSRSPRARSRGSATIPATDAAPRLAPRWVRSSWPTAARTG